MHTIDERLKLHYDDYYGGVELAEWRRLGAIDKVENIVELCKGLRLQSVLDIGCGDGSIVSRMAQLRVAADYQGVDISASAIAAARAQTVPCARFDEFNGSSLPFGSERFDLAVMSHVVEHLEHPRVLLREAQRVAKRVMIEVPCEHTLRLPRDYRPDPVGHINFYTPTTIRRLVQTCGLTVDRQITRGSSLAVLRFGRPWRGTLQYAVRQAALRLAPKAATGIFVYHTALLCH